MESTVQIVVHPQKGMIAAILMPMLLGPIGLLYSCFWTAILISFLFLFALSKGHNGAVAAVFIWLLCIYLSVFFTRRNNNKWVKLKKDSNPKSANESTNKTP